MKTPVKSYYECLTSLLYITGPGRYSDDAVSTVLDIILSNNGTPRFDFNYFYNEYWSPYVFKDVKKILKYLGIKADVTRDCVTIENTTTDIPMYYTKIIRRYCQFNRTIDFRNFIESELSIEPSIGNIKNKNKYNCYYKYL